MVSASAASVDILWFNIHTAPSTQSGPSAGDFIALFSSVIAYYAMWALAIVVFALAVYYTVKQL